MYTYGRVSLVVVLWVGEWVGVCRAPEITQHRNTEQTALDHSANMSTEIKLVYYFQRAKKRKKYETKKAVIFYTSDYY